MNTHPERLPEQQPTGRGKLRLDLSKAVLIVVALIVAILFVYQRYTTSNTRQVASEVTASARAAFETVEPLTGSELQQLRRFRNKEHVEAAEELGVTGVEEREDAAALAEERELVELPDSTLYAVEDMDYSVPFVTPDARALLDTLGSRFQHALENRGLPPYKFVITSGTRTREDQEALQQVNVNAAQKSSHEFGTTVDIRYDEYEYAAEADSLPTGFGINESLLREIVADEAGEMAEAHPEALKAVLGETLHELQTEGKVLVIHERRQPVFHITVASDLTEEADTVGLVSFTGELGR